MNLPVEKMRLIFGRSNAAVGLLIRFFDIVPYGHVAIRFGDSVFEAVGMRYRGRLGRRKGVIETHIDDFKKRYSAWKDGFVYLPPNKRLDDIKAKLIAMVKAKVEYDFAQTIGSLWLVQVLRIKLGSRHALNCSELVNEVAGIFTSGIVTVASWYNILRPMSEY